MKLNRELFESIRLRPGMYFTEERYVVVAAFVLGYDAANDGQILEGYRDWLAEKLGFGANLSWEPLVLSLAFPDAKQPEIEVELSEKNQRVAIDLLFETIYQFTELHR